MATQSTATSTQKETLAYYFVAAMIGVLTGLLGSVFHMLVGHSQQRVHLLPEWLGLEGLWQYVGMAVFCAAMFCAAVALVRKFAPEASGSGVQEVEGAMAGLRTVRWQRVLPVKFVGGLMALGAGLVGGREGPTIHMGASIAQVLGQRFKEARALLGAGAAAGLTAAFNAPLASALFVIEEARNVFPYSVRAYCAVLIACGSSAVMTMVVSGSTPFMQMSSVDMPMYMLPVFVVLGMILGCAGVVFNRAILMGLDFSRRLSLSVSPYLLPTLMGLLIGPLVLSFPQATGGGETLAVFIANHSLSIGMLGLLVLVRFFMTTASYSIGAPAGIFAPILALSATLSVFLGNLLGAVMTLPPDASIAFAVAGMAGMFASTIRAPLVGVVLVIELTGTYSLALPSLLSALSASVVAASLGGRPIYEQLLERTLTLAGQPLPVRKEDM